MSNMIKHINHTYYLFDYINNIKDFDPNDIKWMKSHVKIFLFTSLHL